MKEASAETADVVPRAGGSTRSERYYGLALWMLAGAVVGAHVLGAWAMPASIWGANLYGYLPPITLPLALALLAAGLTVASRPSAWFDRAWLAIPGLGVATTRTTLLRAGAACGVSFVAFWIFRAGHTLLGDGSPLTRSIAMGQRFHPYQPLTVLVHHGFYAIAHRLFPSAGGDPRELARSTIALSSALAGALFVPTAWALASELARFVERRASDRTGDAPGDPHEAGAIPSLVFLILLAQGYVQLFFGYVENYSLSALMLAVYILAALRCLRGAAPLAAAGMALVLGVGFDLSAVLMVPSFLVLAVAALVTPGQRLPALRDLVLVGLLGTGLTALMASVEPGYNLATTAYRVVLQALLGHGDRAQSLAYMFSGVHVRDFLNEQLLIGPAGSFLFVAGAAVALLTRARPSASGWFLFIAGGASLGGAWAATDLGLGYPRDWDLFAPSGIVFTAAALHAVLSSDWGGVRLRRWLFMLASVSLFHTVPWIAVNASFDRSFARFMTLPLGLGRTESAVGAVYLAQGDTAQAIPWFQRSLEAYPANNVAAFRLGQISMRRGMYPEAARAFSIAVRSRPDRENYRFALVDAIVRGGRPPEGARAHLDTLLMRNPAEPAYWACYGVVCLGVDDRGRAASAFERVRELSPGDSALVSSLLLHINEADGYARAVRNEWPSIAGD